MRTLFFLLLVCHTASPVRHSMKFFTTASTEVQNLPVLTAIAVVDEIHAGYCDSNKKMTPKLGSGNNLLEYFPQFLGRFGEEFVEKWPIHYRTRISSFMQQFNQSGGVHTLQTIRGCEWDEATGEVFGFLQFGYDGEDLLSLDLKTQTWVTPKLQAVATKLKWDADKADITFNEEFLTQSCPETLKKYLASDNNILLRTVPPSVSLLQKSPSSPINCFATGFYPNRADMFWRRDGEEIHTDVDKGEILPNPDGTFQMRVDLDLSSVTAQDWSRYECVFQLYGMKDDIITKLEKTKIRTNEETLSNMTILIIAAAAVCALVLAASTAFMAYKKRKAKCHPLDVTGLDQSSDLSLELNPKT